MKMMIMVMMMIILGIVIVIIITSFKIKWIFSWHNISSVKAKGNNFVLLNVQWT